MAVFEEHCILKESECKVLGQGAQIKLEKDANLYPDVLQDDAEAEFDVVSVLQGRLEQVYREIPDKLKRCSEFELCDQADPGPSDYKMRQNFTDAVETAKLTGKKLRVTSIYENVISRQTFFDWYVPNVTRMAFITRRVVTHHQYFDAIFKEGLRKLFLYVRSHDLDPKTVATFVKIVDKAGDRVLGAVAQQINMNQKQLVHHTKSSAVDIDVTPENPAELEEKIREMQAKLNKAKPVEIEAKILTDED